MEFYTWKLPMDSLLLMAMYWDQFTSSETEWKSWKDRKVQYILNSAECCWPIDQHPKQKWHLHQESCCSTSVNAPDWISFDQMYDNMWKPMNHHRRSSRTTEGQYDNLQTEPKSLLRILVQGPNGVRQTTKKEMACFHTQSRVQMGL